jgi:hypothetical protein
MSFKRLVAFASSRPTRHLLVDLDELGHVRGLRLDSIDGLVEHGSLGLSIRDGLSLSLLDALGHISSAGSLKGLAAGDVLLELGQVRDVLAEVRKVLANVAEVGNLDVLADVAEVELVRALENAAAAGLGQVDTVAGLGEVDAVTELGQVGDAATAGLGQVDTVAELGQVRELRSRQLNRGGRSQGEKGGEKDGEGMHLENDSTSEFEVDVLLAAC